MSAFPDDPACMALASELTPRVRAAARRANAAAEANPGKVLIEQ